MTAAEAAELLGLASGTVRQYCRAVGLQKVRGQYDIDPEMVEEWRHSPPEVASLRRAAARAEEDILGGLPLKRHVCERVFNIREARRARKERLLAAMRKAGI